MTNPTNQSIEVGYLVSLNFVQKSNCSYQNIGHSDQNQKVYLKVLTF